MRAWAISRGLPGHYAVEAGGRRYVPRLYPTHWRTRADVLFELDFIRHTAARGVPVAALPRRDGGWLTEVDAPEGPRLAVLFVHAAGDEWVPRNELEAHAIAYDRPPPDRRGRPAATDCFVPIRHIWWTGLHAGTAD